MDQTVYLTVITFSLTCFYYRKANTVINNNNNHQELLYFVSSALKSVPTENQLFPLVRVYPTSPYFK